jgi:hypothetical protein
MLIFQNQEGSIKVTVRLDRKLFSLYKISFKINSSNSE